MDVRGQLAPLSIGGSKVESNVGMCSAFNDFFASVFNGDNDIRYTGVAWGNKTLNNIQVEDVEVLNLLRNVCASKAPGPDDIYPRVLREGANELLGPVA